MCAMRRRTTGRKRHGFLPVALLAVWVGVAYIITDIQYHYISNALLFSASFMLLATAPLLPGLCTRCLRPLMTNGFYSRDKGGVTQIHLSPWANARCRHPRDVAMLKKQLNQCISAALVRGRTVTLRSHLLTRKRTEEIVHFLMQQGIQVSCTSIERPTPLAERALLILLYLLADHRYAPVSRAGLDVTLRPVHP